MDNARRDQILLFLREPIVPSIKDLFEKWKERARGFGPEAPAVFIEMLRDGRFDEQYASLLALRQHGYEAWGHGYGKESYFSVRAPGSGETTLIHPEHPADQGYRAEDGRWVEP